MTEKQRNQQNEIDLLDLFSSLWKGILRFFKIIIDTFLFLFVFGIRRIHWMVLSVIIGFGIGYLRYSQTPRYYSSEMIVQPNGFNSIEMGQYINDIHKMCEQNNIAGIVEALQISEHSAELIQGIEAFFFIDVNRDGLGDHVDYEGKYNPADTTETIIKSRLLIRAQVLNNTSFTEVKEGLIRYIDNNPYLIKVNDLRKRELEARIQQSEKEISKLDSLQDFEYYKSLEDSKLNRQGQIVFMNEKITQLYYRDKESLLSKRLGYQKALELATEPITIIKDFTSLQVEENPMTDYLIKFGFITCILGYILLLYLAHRIIIINYLSSKG